MPLSLQSNQMDSFLSDPKNICETWDQVDAILKSFAWRTLCSNVLKTHIIICVQTSYLFLNNKQFSREPKFQRILKAILKSLRQVTTLPDEVTQLVPRLEKLKLSVRRWSVLRASVKFLSLHSRAVVTANHPSRIDFSVRD